MLINGELELGNRGVHPEQGLVNFVRVEKNPDLKKKPAQWVLLFFCLGFSILQ